MKINLFKSLGKDPKTDWNALLAGFAILLILSVLMNLSFYMRLAKGGDKAGPIPALQTAFNRTELDGVVASLKSKSAASLELPASLFSDPSI